MLAIARELNLSETAFVGPLEMEFPVYDTTPAEVPPGLLAALGLDGCINAAYNTETKILLIEIEDPAVLRELAPDFAALVASHQGINGVLVTAPATGLRTTSTHGTSGPGGERTKIRLLGAHIPSSRNTGQSDWARHGSRPSSLQNARARWRSSWSVTRCSFAATPWSYSTGR